MNKKFIALVLIVIAVFAISGCLSKPKTESTPMGAFVGGTSGLGVAFMANAPASEYPECTEFEADVQLENKGEYTIPTGKATIYLSGISTSAYGIKVNDVSANKAGTSGELTGKQKFGTSTTPGGRDVIAFSSTKGSPDFPGDTTQTLIATACYPYETTSMSTICVQENFAKQTTGGSELCKISGDKTVYNAGAPVQVSALTQFPIGSKPITGITVNLKLRDAGGGTAIRSGATCPSVDQKDVGRITVKEMKLINLGVHGDCENTGKNIVTITGGEGFLTCRFDWSAQQKAGEIKGTFEDILQMKFDYDYTQSTTTKVKFLNMPEGNCAETAPASTGGAVACTGNDETPCCPKELARAAAAQAAPDIPADCKCSNNVCTSGCNVAKCR